MTDKKKFPPLFWFAFAILIVINVSAFWGYSDPLERYASFARASHQVQIGADSVFFDVERHGQRIAECEVVQGGQLNWQAVVDNEVIYQLQLPTATGQEGTETASACQDNDVIKVNFTEADNHNTVLVLLSVDFNNPLKS